MRLASLLWLLVLPAIPAEPEPEAEDTDLSTEAGGAEDTDTGEVDCEQPSDRAALRASLAAAGAAAEARDVRAFIPAYDTSHTLLPCLSQVITPELAASLHAAEYLRVAIDRDEPAMAAALLGATTVPSAAPPSWLSVPEGARVADAAPLLEVESPPYVVVFVDGLPLDARYVDRTALYQAVGPGGEVLWTRWLAADAPLPGGMGTREVQEGPSGAEVLEQVTNLLADGQYQDVIDLAIPAASTYPELESGFRAASDLALDQIRRAQLDPLDVAGYSPYAPRPRRGALLRGDPRQGFLFGFDLGLPSSIHGQWKIGRSAVDGVGLKIGAGAVLQSGSSLYTGVDTSIYIDWNIPRSKRWQLQTTMLGIFFDTSGSAYPNWGAAIQYDPPSPLEITAGVRLGPYTVAPTATVGFLW